MTDASTKQTTKENVSGNSADTPQHSSAASRNVLMTKALLADRPQAPAPLPHQIAAARALEVAPAALSKALRSFLHRMMNDRHISAAQASFLTSLTREIEWQHELRCKIASGDVAAVLNAVDGDEATAITAVSVGTAAASILQRMEIEE